MTEEEQKTIEQLFEAMGKSGGRFVVGQVVGSQTININTSPAQKEEPQDTPSTEEMKQAVLAVTKQGLFWSSRSWAVVYRVYQMKGYKASISEFVREVNAWNIKTDYHCDYDAVRKPIASGKYARSIDKWKADGAQGQAVKLAEGLLAALENGA